MFRPLRSGPSTTLVYLSLRTHLVRCGMSEQLHAPKFRVRPCLHPTLRSVSCTGVVVTVYISIDNGTTWQDANTAPGPSTLEGTPVLLKYVVNNTGNVPLSSVVLPELRPSITFCFEASAPFPTLTIAHVLKPGLTLHHVCIQVREEFLSQLHSFLRDVGHHISGRGDQGTR